MMGHGPGRAGGIGDGEARGEAEGGEAAVEIGDQPRLAAEQVGCAGDVDEQAVGAARLVPRSHDGRIAQAPQGEPAQGLGIGGRIGLARCEIEHLGAGVGDEVARAEAALPGGAVERDDARPSGAGGDEGEGAKRVVCGQPARRPAPSAGGRSASPSTTRKRCATWFHSISHSPGRPLRQRSRATRQRQWASAPKRSRAAGAAAMRQRVAAALAAVGLGPAQHDERRALRAGRQVEPAARGEVEAAGDGAGHRCRSTGPQRLLQRPQRVLVGPGLDEDQPADIEAQLGEAVAVGSAELGERAPGGDEHGRASPRLEAQGR